VFDCFGHLFHSIRAIQKGCTVMQVACVSGHHDIVKYLVQKCQASITIRDREGWTSIDDAEHESWRYEDSFPSFPYGAERATKLQNYLTKKVEKREKVQQKMTKIVLGVKMNILPFYSDVRNIIVTYLQYVP